MANPTDFPTLLLVDGHSLAFRAYYAFANSRDGGLRTSTGIPTSVAFGFTKSLLETMVMEKPDAVALAFDLGGPTFRHEADAKYKANRAETPEDFIPDVNNLTELLRALDLPIFVQPGYEADDVLGTLAQQGSTAGYRVKILSGDRDLFQLVDPAKRISILYMSTAYGKGARSSQIQEYGPEDVKDKLGVTPEQVVDYKALCGDASDNIPGVKGIGPKTAVTLLNEYGSLEVIYESLDKLKPAVRKKLEEDREAAIHSQKMARIITDVAIESEVEFAECCQLRGFDVDKVLPLLEKLELQSFIQQIQKLQTLLGGASRSAHPTEPIAPAPLTPAPDISSDPDLDFFSAAETQAAQRHATETRIQPWVIATPAQLQDLVEKLKTHTDPQNPVAWDTETSALDPRDAELVGIGCCWGVGAADLAYIPLGHSILGSQNLELLPTLQALREILEDPQYPKALQNAKFDRLILKHQGVTLRGVVFDTMLASYLLNPDDNHKLENISQRMLGFSSKSYDQLGLKKGASIGTLPVADIAEYCGFDVYATYQLVPKLRTALAALPKLLDLLTQVEIPLEPILAEMEDQGIRINTAYLREFSKSLETDLAQLEQQAYDAAGETFNLGSPKQLSELFFERLGLDTKKSRKIKTGYSTDAAVLEKLQGDHPVVDYIVEYRTLAKLKSTYVDALPNLVRPETGRVHTDYNQAVTATGRLSSSKPNLQNIPIRTAFSRQIRQAFVPQEGWILVAADYSQIELRILTHLSQEPILVETYRKNEDIHALTAKLLLEKSEITSEDRRLGKIINFGVIYGMGAHRFARETGVSYGQAKGFLDRYHDRYPKIFEYLQRMEQEAIAQGYVETIWGRRRYFNFTGNNLQTLRGKDPSEVDLAKLKPRGFDAGLLRAAANAPIQGSSADIIKIAMVQLSKLLADYQARLLLQVHDELVFEMPLEEWVELEHKIQHSMENAVQLSIPLQVEIRAGANWMEAK